ncbi:MAG: hypothetical protein V3U65_16020 [Granulosicoccaceae bacterium]
MDELFSLSEYVEFPGNPHMVIIQNRVRMDAYTQTLKSISNPEDCVLDSGAGTGVLGFIALQYRVNEVIGVERSASRTLSGEIDATKS